MKVLVSETKSERIYLVGDNQDDIYDEDDGMRTLRKMIVMRLNSMMILMKRCE